MVLHTNWPLTQPPLQAVTWKGWKSSNSITYKLHCESNVFLKLHVSYHKVEACSKSRCRVRGLTSSRREEEVDEGTGPSGFYVPPEGLLPPGNAPPGHAPAAPRTTCGFAKWNKGEGNCILYICCSDCRARTFSDQRRRKRLKRVSRVSSTTSFPFRYCSPPQDGGSDTAWPHGRIKSVKSSDVFLSPSALFKPCWNVLTTVRRKSLSNRWMCVN